MQQLCQEVFEGRLRRGVNGRWSLSNLTIQDLRRIESAFGSEQTQNNVAAHQPAPHWWHDRDRDPDNDHRSWFLSQVRYYEEARAIIVAAIDRR